MNCMSFYFLFFFFNDTATTEIYTLSLHDALPILHDRKNKCGRLSGARLCQAHNVMPFEHDRNRLRLDRKSTRLNSSHANISYAVFCLKKKKTNKSLTISYLTTHITTIFTFVHQYQ